MKNSQDNKKAVATNNGQAITLLKGNNQQGNLTMLLNKVKQCICRHKNTRGVTLVTAHNSKVVKCCDCSKLIIVPSILEGDK